MSSALHKLIKARNVRGLKAELRKDGVDVEVKGSKEMTPLMAAAHSGETEMVRELLRAGALVDACKASGTTALIQAARSGRANVVKVLLSNGAKIDLASNEGWTALNCAAAEGRTDVVKLLIMEGADVNQAQVQGITPLMSASHHGRVEIVRILLANGADIDAADVARGRTALMVAAKEGLDDVVRLLLEHNADATKGDLSNHTALQMAESAKHAQVAQLLEAANARPAQPNTSVQITSSASTGQTISLSSSSLPPPPPAAGGKLCAWTPFQSASRATVSSGAESASPGPVRQTSPDTPPLSTASPSPNPPSPSDPAATAETHGPVVYRPNPTQPRRAKENESRSANLGHSQSKTAPLWPSSKPFDAKESNTQGDLLPATRFPPTVEEQFADAANNPSRVLTSAIFVHDESSAGAVLTARAVHDESSAGAVLTARAVNAGPPSSNQSTTGSGTTTPLMTAAKQGCVADVAALVASGADPNVRGVRGRTALTLAASCGHAKIVEALIKRGAEVNARLNSGFTALILAARAGDVNSAQCLVDHGAEISAIDKDGLTALMHAAACGKDKIVSLLMQSARMTESRQATLELAVRSGNVKCASLLLGESSDVNCETSDEDGLSLLMLATRAGFTALTAFLVDCGAHVDHEAKHGGTALLFAAAGGFLTVAEVLLNAGASLSKSTESGLTPIIAAAEKGHLDMVKLLLKSGADIEQETVEGHTALIAAAEHGHVEVVTYLLERGANIDQQTAKGCTALVVAASKGQDAVVKALVAHGNRCVQTSTHGGLTPLMIAAEHCQPCTVEALIQAGAVVDCDSSGFKSALEIAVDCDRVEVAVALLRAKADASRVALPERGVLTKAQRLIRWVGTNSAAQLLKSFGLEKYLGDLFRLYESQAIPEGASDEDILKLLGIMESQYRNLLFKMMRIDRDGDSRRRRSH